MVCGALTHFPPHPLQVGPSAGAALSVRPTTQLAFSGGSCLALAVTPTTATTTVTAVTGTSSSSSTTTRRLGPNGPWVHGLYGTHLPVPHGGLELSYTVACTGSSRVALLLHFAREGHEGAGAAAAGAGAEAACGLAVGPWTTGDKATVESLRAAGGPNGVGSDDVVYWYRMGEWAAVPHAS